MDLLHSYLALLGFDLLGFCLGLLGFALLAADLAALPQKSWALDACPSAESFSNLPGL